MADAVDMLVVGLGRSGLATVRHALTRSVSGAVSSVAAVDEKDDGRLREVAAELRSLGVPVTLGASVVEGEFDLAVVSPGISPARPLFASAKRASRAVISEIEYAYRESRSPWLAITGTNGKTTTTSLVAHLLGRGGFAHRLVGNIGTPAIDVVDEAGSEVALVAEVSSFQLELTEAFHPRVAVLLNITPDHLDWHGGMEAYGAAKVRVFANQQLGDTAVIDVDDEGSAPVADAVEASGARVMRVSRRYLPPGGAGLLAGTLALDDADGPVELVSASELKIRGDHNVSNALAASAAAFAFGVGIASIREGLRSFEPIEHRLEPAGEVLGVRYFNDSKATNPDAVLKALTAFGEQPLVVLLGGRNKGNDFRSLAEAVVARCKVAVLFGESRMELREAFRETTVSVLETATMADALLAASELASPGDAVLLSPACASFDEFAGYEERGWVFKRLVAEMASSEASGGAA